ncbi:hypothetical protein B7R54_15310 [Subtercola boreus]|uniref:Uncharacterized protein n=1 Tax=Subtercola boreus TaxID=120213 RepID=A0A3E0VLW4_9MICO|nr:hypothetical protein [Subtercola boreus]RFA10420.1 hypothetical protein B7R54_15310 [Subtercola boreus]TQL56057.1 hypothetical protein FB464_3636 [Subtercola boreus]
MSERQELRLIFTTPATRSALRRKQLEASGVRLLTELGAGGTDGTDGAGHRPALPAERNVWRLMASSSVVPLRMIPSDEVAEARAAAHREWLALSSELAVVAADGSFLISVPTDGPDLGWARVMLTPETLLPSDQIDEFVALSEDGVHYSAVSSEEHGYWIIVGETGQPPR